MGSGKSSVGKLLSKRLDLPLIETDEEILNQSGIKSINEIFMDEGELRFRELETDVTKKLKSINDAVIVTGGGLVINKVNIDLLKSQGNNIIVFLKSEFKTIKKRLKNDHDRPLFSNIQKAKKLFEIRQPLYKNYADTVIKTDNKTINRITEEVMKGLENL